MGGKTLAPDTKWAKPIGAGISIADLGELLVQQFNAIADAQALDQDRDASWVIPVDQLRAALAFLRDDERVQANGLLDITAIDYLAYPGWREERFAVVYQLKSFALKNRLRLKVLVEEDATEVPSVHDIFAIADWLERETYDQYGITFTGHPNLKRLLNHHEFDGHPLRKDYPVQRRQHLSVNDPMLDEVTQLLERRGYKIIERDSADAVQAELNAASAGGSA